MEKHRLTGIRLLAGLPREALAGLETKVRRSRHEAGTTIMSVDDPGSDVAFIIEGRVRASIYDVSGEAVYFRELAAGDTVGELAAIDGHSRSASIEALTDTTVARLPAAAFRTLLLEQPALCLKVLEDTIQLVRALSSRVVEFSTSSVNQRIRAEIYRRASAIPADGRPLELAGFTHADLAAYVSTHREAVSRELSALARRGIVERRGRKLVVLDLAELGRLVEQES